MNRYEKLLSISFLCVYSHVINHCLSWAENAKKKGQNLILGLPLQRIKQYEQKSYFLVPLPVFFFLVVLQAILNTSFLKTKKEIACFKNPVIQLTFSIGVVDY